MKSVPTDELKPMNESGKRRVQRVVKAFLEHQNDKDKRLAAIQEALELSAKEPRSEVQRKEAESGKGSANL